MISIWLISGRSSARCNGIIRFYLHRHQTYTCIDIIWVSEQIGAEIVLAEIGNLILQWQVFGIGPIKGTDNMSGALMAFCWKCRGTGCSKSGKSQVFFFPINEGTVDDITNVELRKQRLESMHKLHPIRELLDKLDESKNQLKLMAAHDIVKDIMFSRQRCLNTRDNVPRENPLHDYSPRRRRRTYKYIYKRKMGMSFMSLGAIEHFLLVFMNLFMLQIVPHKAKKGSLAV